MPEPKEVGFELKTKTTNDGMYDHHLRLPVGFPWSNIPPSEVSTFVETDPTVLARRSKQLSYGKVQECYKEYTKRVPKEQREYGDPKTPDLNSKYSRRKWDRLVKNWKIKLHCLHNEYLQNMEEPRKQGNHIGVDIEAGRRELIKDSFEMANSTAEFA